MLKWRPKFSEMNSVFSSHYIFQWKVKAKMAVTIENSEENSLALQLLGGGKIIMWSRKCLGTEIFDVSHQSNNK